MSRMPQAGVLADPAAPGFQEAAGEYVRRVHEAYRVRADWHRRLYRLSGVIVIVAGSSLPLLTALSFSHKSLAISLVGITSSGVVALRSFYRWDQGWVLLRVTQYAIDDAYWQWIVSLREGAGSASDDAARDATLDLLSRVADIRRNEATAYFNELPLPGGGGAPGRRSGGL